MESNILGNFVKRDVEILVAGVWIAGHMAPIVKGVVTLIPIGEEKAFYGPTAVKVEVIQAIREVRRQPTANSSQVNSNSSPPQPVQSGFAPASQSNHPGMKYVHK